MECFRDGLPTLLSATSRKGGDEFAEAIMTTDLVPKEYFRERTIGGKKVKVAGVCKGSGMIAPNMATMLAFLVTDARIPRRLFQELLREVTDESFNMTSVDTDTSTNDMFLAFSTGGVEINPAKDRAALKELLLDCAVDLAKQIARDGEGATRLVEVKVSGGKTLRQARAVAKSVVDSPLVKTAIHGADPNWGRVAAATGKVSGVVADKVSISFAGTKVLQKGQPLRFNRDTLRARLNKPTVVVEVALGLGKFSATAWGCDLTHGYVDINTEYN
jgi:glutamate N-acetyltransferase/amino-acid N-acetyltransferase